MTSRVLFYLPSNSEIIAKNYSVLIACRALLSCFTLTFFTPHGNPICLPETCSTVRGSAHPITTLEKGRAGWPRAEGPCTAPFHPTNLPLRQKSPNTECLRSLLRTVAAPVLTCFTQQAQGCSQRCVGKYLTSISPDL